VREQTNHQWDKRYGIDSLVLLRHLPEEIQALVAMENIPGTKAMQIHLEHLTKQLPTRRKRASCPGAGARRKCPRVRPAGQPLRGTAAATRTAGGSRAAAAAAGARPPRRGSTPREAPRTAGRPRAPPCPGTRRREEEAPARGRTRRSGASSASPSARAVGSEPPIGHRRVLISQSGRRFLSFLARWVNRPGWDRCSLQLKRIGKWM